MRGIRLSEQHGVNPSLGVCFYCLKEDGTVILPGRLRGDAEAPRSAVWSMEPCRECSEHMKAGIVLISVDESLSHDKRNPYRTGGWVVIREEAFRRIFSGPPADAALKCRFCFVVDEAWNKLGLPAVGKSS